MIKQTLEQTLDTLRYQQENVRYRKLLDEDYDVVLKPVPRKIVVPSASVRSASIGNWGFNYHEVPAFVAANKNKRSDVKVIFHVLDTGAVADNKYLNNRGQMIRDEGKARNWTRSKDRIDRNFHWSHVNGIINAYHPNILLGLCQHEEIPNWTFTIGQKVLNDQGAGYDQDIEKGLYHAFEIGQKHYPVSDGYRHVIIMSFGSSGSRMKKTEQAVQEITRNAGWFAFAAAGNDGDPGQGRENVSSPGTSPHVITSGAIDQNGFIAYFSSRGNDVDFASAGVDILSTYRGDLLAKMNGTSMGNPMTAALAAWVLRYNPWITTTGELHNALKSKVTDAGPEGFDPNYGFGIIELDKYKDGVNNPNPDNPPNDEEPNEPDTPDKPDDPDTPAPGPASQSLHWVFDLPVSFVFRDHIANKVEDQRGVKPGGMVARISVEVSDKHAGSELVSRDGVVNLSRQILNRYQGAAIAGNRDQEFIDAMQKLGTSVEVLSHSPNANYSTIAKEWAYLIRDRVVNFDRFLKSKVQVEIIHDGGQKTLFSIGNSTAF